MPQSPKEDLQAIIQEIETIGTEGILRKSVALGPRDASSTQIDGTDRRSKELNHGEMRFNAAQSKDRMQITVPSLVPGNADVIQLPARISNIVAPLRGGPDPGRIHVVSVHYEKIVDLQRVWILNMLRWARLMNTCSSDCDIP